MQQRAGLLFLAKSTGRILLIYELNSWTVPTFLRRQSVIDDAKELLRNFSDGKIVPIELYLSEDRGFEYGTYVCLVENEFLTSAARTIAWCGRENLPKNLHIGLKTTLNNQTVKIKIETILELEYAIITE